MQQRNINKLSGGLDIWHRLFRREQLQFSFPPLSRFRLYALALVGVILAAVQPSTFGATVTWTGAANNNWFNATNWNPVGVPASTDTIVFTSGTINLTNSVTIGGVFNWSGGTLTGSPLTIAANGIMNLTGSSTKTFANVLTNAGTVVWTGGQLTSQNYAPYGFVGAVENLPGGLWDIQCDQGVYNNYGGGSPYFRNAGTVQKSVGTATATFGIAFTNSGSLVAQTGVINLNSGGLIEGNFAAQTGALIQFTGGAFAYGTAPVLTGSGTIQITGGTLTLLTNVIPGLQLVGGTLSLSPTFQGGSITNLTLNGATLAGDHVLTGILNLNSGTLSGGLTVTNGATLNWSSGAAGSYVNVTTNGLVNLIGGSTKYIVNVLTNAGTVVWQGGQLTTQNYPPYGYWGSVVNLPGGLWDIQCDQGMYNNYGGGAPYFANAGTLQKTVGTGTTTFGVTFTNTGTVIAQTGTINFNSGGLIEGNFAAQAGTAIHFNGGAFGYANAPALAGAGAIQFSSGSLTLQNNIILGLQLVGGTLSLSPSFQQGGSITNLTLSGSTLAGTNVVAGTLNWNGSTLSGPLSVTNGGTVNWTSGAAGNYVYVGTNGLVNLIGGGTKYFVNVFTNAGTVVWLGGQITTQNYPPYGYLGSIVNLPGGLWDIQCDQGIYNNYSGGAPYFVNAGTLQKTVGTGTSTFGLALTNSGSVIAQTGTLNFNGGGLMEGNFTALAGTSILFTGGAFTYVTVPVMTGPGAIQFTGGSLVLQNNIIPGLQITGGSISLSPTFQGGSITNLSFGGSLNGNYLVSGTLSLGNGGSGILTISNGATLNWSGGTLGGLVLSNGATVNWSGGTLASGLNVVDGATVNWSSGAASSYVYVATNGVVNLTGGGTKYFVNVFTNAGTVTWQGGTLYTQNYPPYGYWGAVVNLPGGLWDIQCDQGMYNNYGGGSPYFANAGTLQKTVGTGSTTFGVTFTNTGSVLAQTGTLNFISGGLLEGSFTALTGATILFSGGVFTYATVPVITGPGAIQFSGGSLALLDNVIPGLQLTGGSISLSPTFQGGSITNLTFGGSLTSNSIVTGTLTLGNGGSAILTVSNGATLNWSGGTLGGLVLSNGATVNWSGGTLASGLNVVNGATINWSGGASGSYVYVATNGVVNLIGGGTKYFVNVFTNAGTVTWQGGTLYTQNYPPYGYWGAVVNLPGGLWDIQCDQGMYDNYGGGSPYFANAGTLQKTVGTGTTTFDVAFTNAGTVIAQTGTINFSGGGLLESNFTASAGSTIQFTGGAFTYATVPVLTGPGAIRFTGGSLALLDNTIPGLQLVGGSVSLSPSFQGGSITNLTNGGSLNGSYVVSGALTLGNGGSGTLTVSNGATLNWSAGTLAGLVLSNGATVNWSGGTLASGLNVVDGATMNWSGGASGGYVYVATNGLVNLTGGGTKYFVNVFTNAGTVVWLGGTLYTQNYPPYGYLGAVENLPGGLWDIQCDQSIYNGYSGGSPYFHNVGTVQKSVGTGTTTISIPFVNNTGTLDVETGAVSFNQNNSYGQTAATLRFGLGGPGKSGQVNIAGTMNFDGTLAAALVRGYLPKTGDAISLVTYNSRAGAFENLDLPALSSTLGWQVAYNAGALQVLVITNANTATQISGLVQNNAAQPVTNVTVFAYTTNSSGSLYFNTVTDGTGHYSLNVSNGVWLVGLQNLPSLGYNPVANQTVTISNASQTVNFTLEPYSLQFYPITTAVNPAGAGTTSGDGVFPNGSVITVKASAITNALPYYFASWTENGVFESASTNYTFTVSRSRNLTANFTLPTYQISANNNPASAGSVSGAGTYFYGTTNVLTANANYGYRFLSWTENGNLLATTPSFTNLVTSNRLVVANYAEANTLHVVTTATSPTNLATVTGAGNFTNGQTINLSAPASLTLSAFIYTFREFRVNGALASYSPTLSRTLSTLDPTNLDYVAVYDVKSIQPTVINLIAGITNVVQGGFTSITNPVPATTNYQITLQFDRSMATNVSPLVVLTNSLASVQPFIPTNGNWFATATSNDTYRTPFITFSNGMGGVAQLKVSGAIDPLARQMAATNLAALTIDVTPPTNPVIVLASSNSYSAQVSWSGYVPPTDLGSFRLYLSTNNFSSVAGLNPLSSVGASSRSFTFSGLALDRPYFAAVVAVDLAGNSSPAITPLPFTLVSSVPPPVTVQVTALGSASAVLTWSGYNSSQLLGFAGFQIYYETNDFTSVAGLTPKTTLTAGVTSLQIDNLDRTRTYHFAVVGYNVNNAVNPAVTTASWSDPYAGSISVNTTLGGANQKVVDILQNITVVNNAILTVPAGTTLRFAPGTGLTVQQGALFALGTSLDPVIFTSLNDQPGQTPAAGDWNGITLNAAASPSVLMNFYVNYGAGLTLNNCQPTVGGMTAANNIPAGLTLQNSAVLTTADALLTFNGIGVQQLGSAQLTLTNSVIKNNGTNALATGGPILHANANWWGSATQAVIAATLRGAVDSTSFLTGEPLLTPALATSNGVTQVGSQLVSLRLACRTAEAMRLSEDSTFAGVFFTTFSNTTPFQLSNGGGQKTVFAQFRSVTGTTNQPVSLTLNYVTAGPTINAFTLTEGQLLTRPLNVTGSATAPLGMAQLEFYVDGTGVQTNAGGSFSLLFDVRNLSAGTHRVELLARDNGGNFATLAHNVTVSPVPPPTPVIVTPATDLVVNSNTVFISGTAEPFIPVRLFNSGVLVGLTNAAANGTFSFVSVPLTEGANQFIALVMDQLGSASSLTRTINLDTTAPAPLTLNSPTYLPGNGLTLSWLYNASGKRASNFKVFWSTSAIANTSQASGQTLLLSSMNTTLQSLAPGNYYFYVVGYDALGNASPLSAPATNHYDPVPPSFTVSFDKSSPVTTGPVHVILTASEPLNGMPTMTVKPLGSSPALLTLSNTTVNTYEADLNVTTLLPSGTVQLNVSAQDLAGNPFNGAPSGPALVIDVTPPAGDLSTAPVPPVQATNTTAVAVSLKLTEAPQNGAPPTLTFAPPQGSTVPVTLAGSGTNWSGSFNVTAAMGSGIGHFALTVSDALGNVGHSLNSGSSLEIYNTALPTPPGQPVHFTATSQAGGQIVLTWSNVPDAEMYRVYSETGNVLTVPTVLLADGITNTQYVDTPGTDGYYRYVVSALRRGAEGSNSIVRVATSDRLPPLAPTNVAVQLVGTGLQITWQPGGGETPDHYNIYRNGTLIRNQASASPVIDSPPRGVMNYTVGAADVLGNETLSTPATIQLLVGAVNNLQAVASAGQGPVLTWTSPDGTAVGFNVYRGGIRQNLTALTSATFTDPLPMASAPVTYAVTALNATNAESVARTVTVYPVQLGLLVNAAGSTTNNAPVTSYFDDYQLTVSNLASATALPLQQVTLVRQAAGTSPLNLVNPVNNPVAGGGSYTAELAVPCASNTSPQTVSVIAQQQPDTGGAGVVYQQTFTLPNSQTPGLMAQVSANQLPLAGGLTPFDVRIYNRGYTPMYFVTARGGGLQPGDLYIAVKNPAGQEVSRTSFTGLPAGVIFSGDIGYLMIPPGSSATVTVPSVLVPSALASNTVTFQAVVSTIYDRVTAAGQQASGPLVGSMQSALSQTPYYGTAQTDHALYSGDTPVLITGQALDRISGLPVTNAPLKIGFATRGYHWYQDVTTDSSGNYSLTYNVTPGLAGTLTIWAAHPAVVDQLNQAQISIYRMYASPPSGDVRMSKNDTLPFSLSLLNPGDLPLTGFTTSFQCYTMQGTNQVPVTTVHGTNLLGNGFTILAGQRQPLTLQLAADANAPDNVVAVFTLTSSEGASASFTANVTLLPAVPIISVLSPANGYVEVSLDRGGLVSRQVTVMNSGLKDLQGVTIRPPTNINWMVVNLPTTTNGVISLPDLPVGATNSFTVVFTPPSDTSLGFFQDQLTIQGTNAQAGFTVPLYARVTSAKTGSVQFIIDDILGLYVPNATIRLRNTALQVELPAVQTDINGLVTVTNLQEGDWSWQVVAAGYSGNVGVTTVIPDQTVQTHSRLNKSLVTVNFSVTPVPFSDTYDITIEQTFETHVPIPVLVLTPTLQQFYGVKPGFQATYIVTAKNEGLVQMTDLSFTGQQNGVSTMTPLITYVPVLLPQQSIQVPITVTYSGSSAPTQQDDLPGSILGCVGFGNIDTMADFIAGMAAFAQAFGRCPSDQAAIAIASATAVTMQIVADAVSAAGNLTGGLANFLGCVLGNLIGPLELPFPGIFGIQTAAPANSSVQNFQSGSTGCFAPDTAVLLADGTSKPIAQIKAGDVVKSGVNPNATAVVAQSYQRNDQTCRVLRLDQTGAGEPDRIQTTDEHLFWVDGQGWVAASELRVGSWLMNDHGQRVRVASNESLPGWHPVYTLKLRGDTAFYANGILVHDLCGEWPVASRSQPPAARPTVRLETTSLATP